MKAWIPRRNDAPFNVERCRRVTPTEGYRVRRTSGNNSRSLRKITKNTAKKCDLSVRVPVFLRWQRNGGRHQLMGSETGIDIA